MLDLNAENAKDDVKAALEAADRTQGGPTAPPDGLYLTRVSYQPISKQR